MNRLAIQSISKGQRMLFGAVIKCYLGIFGMDLVADFEGILVVLFVGGLGAFRGWDNTSTDLLYSLGFVAVGSAALFLVVLAWGAKPVCR